MSGAATVGTLVVAVTGTADDLKATMAEARSIVGDATKEMVVNVGAVSAETDKMTSAGKRMVAALQEEVRTFGMSREEILIYKASLTGAGSEVERLAGQLQALKAQQASAAQQASDAAAAARATAAAQLAEASAISARTEAGQRLLDSMREEIATFGMSADELRIYRASMLGVGDQAQVLVERINAMKSAQAGLTDQQSAAETAAQQRIRTMVAASMTETAAINDAAGATQRFGNVQSAGAHVSANWSEAQRLQALNMQGVAAAMRGVSDQSVVLSAGTQRILDKYDPLGTKLRSLQSDMVTLRKEMGNSVDPAAIKAFQGLEDEITKTQKLMAQAGVDGFGKVEDGAKRSAFATAGATRELMVLGHEVISGNFSRIPGSLMVLAERMGGITEFLTPMTIGFVALAVAGLGVAGAMLKGHDDLVAMNNAMLVTSDYAGTSRQSMTALAESMTQTHEVTIGTANAIVLALTASGKVGGEAIGQIAHFISDFAKATGESIDQVAPKMIALFEDPIRGANELNSSMHFLTTSQLEHIAALERTGQVQAAQSELAKAASDHMPKQAENMGYVTKALLDQRDAWTKVGQAMLNWGKAEDTSANAQAQKVRDEISELLTKGFTRQSPQVEYWQRVLDAMDPALKKQQEMTQAQKDAAAANELQAKSWDAVKSSSTAYHVQELQDRLKLIAAHKSEAGPDFAAQEAAKRDAIRKTNDEIDTATRSLTAEDRQLYEQRMANEDAISQVKLKSEANDVETLYKLGKISKDDYDQRMLMISLEENQEKQNYERAILRRADLSTVEYNAHKQKLALLQAEHDAIESKGVNAQMVDEKKQMDDYIAALDKVGATTLKSLDEQIAKEHQHGLEIGLTKAQVDDLHSAQQKTATADLQAQADAIAALLTQNDLNVEARKIYEALLPQINAQIAARRTLAQISGENAVREADAKAAEEATKAWKHATDTIENDLTNAIIDGGGRGWKKLIRDMEMAFAKMVLQPILAPISGGMATYLAPFMGSPASAVGASGSGSGLVGAAQSASSLYKLGSAGASAATGLGSMFQGAGSFLGSSGMSAYGAGMSASAAGSGDAAMYASAEAAGNLAPGAAAGQATGAAISSYAVPIAAAIASYYAAKAISGGYKVEGIGTALNYAGIIGGIVNRAFGMGPTQVQSQGMKGTLSADSLTGQNYQDLHQNGGWFRSDKNWQTTSGFTAATVSQFTQGLAALETASTGFATSLGASADSIKDYSKSFDLTLTGDASKDAQTVTTFFADLGDEMANKLIPNLADFSKTGETASATLQRLAGDFAATNQMAQLIGKSAADVFGSMGMDSAAARERLIDLSGGVSVLSQQAQSYAQNFLTDAQKLAPVQKALDAAMASLGLSCVQTREQFKAVVDSLDLTTASGAQEYTSLMKLADAFAQVHPQIDAVTAAADASAAALQTMKDSAATLVSDVDNAFTVLQNVTKGTTDTINARITAEQALSSALKSTLSGMNAASIDLTERAAAQAQIKAALAIAKAGGPLPTAESLQGALSTVSQDASAKFSTYADYLKDLYSTKNDLSALSGLTDSALSVDQKQLNTLNDMLAAAQKQVDLLKGIDTSALTIPGALAGLQTAIIAAQANPYAGSSAGINQAYQSALGRAPDAAGMAYFQNAAAHGASMSDIVSAIQGSPEAQVQSLYHSLLGRTADAAGLNYWLKSGESMTQIASDIKSSAEYKHLNGVPGFATGGDFGGGLRIVGEHGPELEATGPARIFNAGQTANILSRLSNPSENNAALLAALKAVQQELKLSREKNSAENVAQVKQQQNTNAILERVIYGGDSIQTTVVKTVAPS